MSTPEEDPRFLLTAAPLSSYLPVVAQLRLASTCKAWHAALARCPCPRVDLTAAAGVCAETVTDEVLRAAVARAQGRLESLDVWNCVSLSATALFAELTANAATLRELRAGHTSGEADDGAADTAELTCAAVTQLLSQAPLLRVLDVTLRGDVDSAMVLLHELQLRVGLKARCGVMSGDGVQAFPQAIALRAQALAGLQPGQPPPPFVPPACFAEVRVAWGHGTWNHQLFLTPAMLATLLYALQRQRNIHAIKLDTQEIAFNSQIDAFGVRRYPVAEALGALLSADLATLTAFSLRSLTRVLEDIDLAPMVAALPLNSHLQTLEIVGDASTEDAAADAALAAFARGTLLPAVAANAGLRELRFCRERPVAELRQAEAIVQQRAQQPSA